jgi:glycine/D-amino acid oxidase-like deaminating enzyme
LKLTTLAIIGSGIAGRSLIYTLAKEQKAFEKITLFCSDNFFPCTLNSTAIVAPRGLSRGHSPLGDILMDGFELFSHHVVADLPSGVEKIVQYTGASNKVEDFKRRYPNGKVKRFYFHEDTYLAEDDAYLIDPEAYGKWLLGFHEGEIINDVVTELIEGDQIHLQTHSGKTFLFDKVVFAGGSYNRFWKDLMPDSKLKTSKPVQGSYLEFNRVKFTMPSFSLTYNGDNLIWNASLNRLLIGSSSVETNNLLPPMEELKCIYERLHQKMNLELPPFESGQVRTGLREKAQKREPYIIHDKSKLFLGGLYKNGFTLAMKMSQDLIRQYL